VILSCCQRRWSRRSVGDAPAAPRCRSRLISRYRPRVRLVAPVIGSPGGCCECGTPATWPGPAMTRAPLTGADLYDWIALRRVSGGGMAKLGDRWLDSGHRVPGYVTEALVVLRGDGLVTLADSQPGGMARPHSPTSALPATSSYASNGKQPCGCPPHASAPPAADLVSTTLTRPAAQHCPTKSPAGRRLGSPAFGSRRPVGHEQIPR
jgi:hypothetical protein